MRKIMSHGLLLSLIQLTACTDDAPADPADAIDMDEVSEEQPDGSDGDNDGAGDDGQGDDGDGQADATKFRIRLENATQYLGAQTFDTAEGAQQEGPLESVGQKYVVRFKAQPGTRLSFASMSATTNDWFFTLPGTGLALFDDKGAPVTGDISAMVRLYDSGTEEEDPATVASVSGGKNLGSPDDDVNVRLQTEDVTDMIRVSLAYTTQFELTIERVGDAVITPGVLLLHALDNPLFESKTPDRGHGLEQLSRAGDPSVLFGWLTAEGSSGAPLRMSTSLTPFSPGVAYLFQGDNPLFAQGKAARDETGLENLAEYGDNTKVYSYLQAQGYTPRRARAAVCQAMLCSSSSPPSPETC